jgi:hypothetical protein
MILSTATLAIASLLSTAPIFGQISNNNNTSSDMTRLSTKPLFSSHYEITHSSTGANDSTTHVRIKGNTTFMLSSGEEVSTSSKGKVKVTPEDGFTKASGHVLVETMDGKENATIAFTDYTPENANVGIGVVAIQTNLTTGQLALLNNSIGVSKDEFIPQTQEAIMTFWKWK